MSSISADKVKELRDISGAANECEDSNEVFVGRVREDISIKNGINMWIVSNNIRKGAAYNSVQIAELLIKDYL